MALFWSNFYLFQNLKVVIYKGFKIWGELKYPKTGYLIAIFLEIKVRLKALSVHLKGIPEEGL